MVDRRADHAVQVQLGAARAAAGDVRDREVVQTRARTRGAGLYLDAVRAADVGLRTVQREVAERNVVRGDEHAVARYRPRIDDGLRLACPGERHALIDVQRGRLRIGAGLDVDEPAPDHCV